MFRISDVEKARGGSIPAKKVASSRDRLRDGLYIYVPPRRTLGCSLPVPNQVACAHIPLESPLFFWPFFRLHFVSIRETMRGFPAEGRQEGSDKHVGLTPVDALGQQTSNNNEEA